MRFRKRKAVYPSFSSPFRKKKKLYPKILLLAGIVLALIFLFGDNGVYRLYSKRAEKEQLLKDIEALKQEQQKLKAEEGRLEGDMKYLEKLARNKYRMAKQGEKVFRVVEE